MPDRAYTYYDLTVSICPQCLQRIDAKIIFENDCVYQVKHCQQHGHFKIKLSSDIDYYIKCRHFIKPGQTPLQFNTKTKYGCPYDCGLCPDHEQHSCLSIVEVTERCNLTCPTCYASSSPHHGQHRSLAQINEMFDLIVRNEGFADVVQISGGEPTIHPEFWQILDLAKTKSIRHLMLNTNGIKLAMNEAFVERLASYQPGFEIYLQFDAFAANSLQQLRGVDLRESRLKAIEHLNKYKLSTSLVCTLQQGLNDGEIGDIIDFAIKQPAVRGITFQATQYAGRNDNSRAADGKLTISDIRRQITTQSPYFTAQDIVPVPCNPDSLAMAYALKLDDNIHPLSRYINAEDLLQQAGNTIVYEHDESLKQHLLKIFSTAYSVDEITEDLHSLMCCLPQIKAPNFNYQHVFRIIIIDFMDAYNFDVRSVKKSCVHIATTDGRLIPFETMNLFYRNNRIHMLRQQLLR